MRKLLSWKYHLEFPLSYMIITIQIGIAAFDFGQRFLKQNNPKLTCFFVGLAEDRLPILMDRNKIINDDFFHTSIDSQVYLV